MKSFEWKASKSLLLSRCTTGFMSNLSVIDGFIFMMEFYPRQIDDYGDQQCMLQLHLLSLPSNTAYLSHIYNFRIKETNIECSWMTRLPRSEYELSTIVMDTECISLQEIEELNSLTFVCNIQILDVMTKNRKLLNNKNICPSKIELSPCQ